MRKKLQSFVFFLLLTVIVFTGCASMFGNKKTVELNTNPARSTAIVYDRKGTTIETTSTPNKIKFKKAGSYTVEFNMNDYLPETISIKKKFNHSFWLNFLVSGIGVSTVMIFDPHFEFQRNNYYAYAGYGLSAIGVVGVLYDIFSGSLVGVSPEKVNLNLKLTPEATARREEERHETLARQEAQRQAEAEEREAKRQAETLERQRVEDERRKVIEEVNT
jgi:hypothetical protein